MCDRITEVKLVSAATVTSGVFKAEGQRGKEGRDCRIKVLPGQAHSTVTDHYAVSVMCERFDDLQTSRATEMILVEEC